MKTVLLIVGKTLLLLLFMLVLHAAYDYFSGDVAINTHQYWVHNIPRWAFVALIMAVYWHFREKTDSG